MSLAEFKTVVLQVWSGDMQRTIKKALLNALPPLRPWDESDRNKQMLFLQDVCSLHAELGNFDRIQYVLLLCDATFETDAAHHPS